LNLPRTIAGLDTPALLIERSRLDANLAEMAALCARYGVRLRPHVKTHKCPAIAARQRALGAVGLCAAKVSEAAVFAAAGFDDLLVAYPLTGARKVAALRALPARVSTLADDVEGVRELDAAWSGEPLPVHVKVDVGLGRVGVRWDRPEAVVALAQAIDAAPNLRFAGLLTHAGHAYGAAPEDVARIGREEGERLVALAGAVRDAGLEVPSVSVGSTPTARHAVAVPGVTELRPGVYALNDANQVRLGVVPVERCALSVLTTVVSRPDPDRAFCDAGSKVFSSDRGAHGQAHGDHGLVVDRPDLRLVALSEEHGWLRGPARRGERLRVVPAHTCPVVNLAAEVWLVDGDDVLERWDVAARGCVR
jgi:D-serine deaminase-like pyridoxal phosphate-dependent protein